jgi:hypothetical protein
MTTHLETNNHGSVDGFGFSSSYLDQAARLGTVHLGELNPISLRQFCEFSAEAMEEVALHLDPFSFNTFENHVHNLEEKLDQGKVIQSFPVTYAPKHLHNPFIVAEFDNLVSISDVYNVGYGKFVNFVLYVFEGGHIGWGKEGVPHFVRQNLKKISSAFQRSREILGKSGTDNLHPPFSRD